MERSKDKIGYIIIIVTYLVGVFGFRLEASKELFLLMVPFHLLLVFGIILWLHKTWDSRFVAFLILCYSISFASEYIGVHTGLLFGDYLYGTVLGLKLADVPLIIGINWVMLIYLAFAISEKLSFSTWLTVFIGAVILTVLDFIMEPGAIRLGFWNWTHGDIPVFNYICWFGLSLLLLVIAKLLKIKAELNISLVIIFCQVLFFFALRF